MVRGKGMLAQLMRAALNAHYDRVETVRGAEPELKYIVAKSRQAMTFAYRQQYGDAFVAIQSASKMLCEIPSEGREDRQTLVTDLAQRLDAYRQELQAKKNKKKSSLEEAAHNLECQVHLINVALNNS